MPSLDITTDATSTITINDVKLGVLSANERTRYDNLLPGLYYVSLTNVYKSFLSIKKEVNLVQDTELSFSFRSIVSHYLDSLELFQFRENYKAGLFEPITRTVIVVPKYHNISTFGKNGIAIVEYEYGGKKGLINKRGEMVLPCDYDRIIRYTNGYVVQKDNLYGLLGVHGASVIDLQPYEIKVCQESNVIEGCYYRTLKDSVFFNSCGERIIKGDFDYFSVKKAQKKKFIFAHKDKTIAVYDFEGILIIGPQYNDVSIEGILFRVSFGSYYDKGSQSGLIDFSGTPVTAVAYSEVRLLSGDFFEIGNNGKTRTYRYNGIKLIEFPYPFYRKLSDEYIEFANGSMRILFNVQSNNQITVECDDIDMLPDPIKGGYCNDFFTITRNGKWGLVSSSGAVLCNCLYDYIRGFINGYACVRKGHYYGAIDSTGREVIPCEYGGEFEFSCDGYAAVFNIWGRHNGYVIDNDLINTKNERVLGHHSFSEICWLSSFNRETHPILRAKMSNSKDCLIDFNGKVIRSSYDKILTRIPDEDGCYFVCNIVNGVKRIGWVNRFGEEKIPCKYDSITNAGRSRLWCVLNGKKALFKDDGEQLTAFVYDETEDFHGKYCIAKKTTGYGVLSDAGKEITSFEYSYIKNFYVGHQSDDFDVIDADEDGIYEDDIEGPFRYGLTFATTNKEERLLIDTKGNTVSLQHL